MGIAYCARTRHLAAAQGEGSNCACESFATLAGGAGFGAMSKRSAEEMLVQMRRDQPLFDPKLAKRHHFLPPENREKVVEFIAEVCEEFGLQTQTAGLAVHYFD